MERILGNYIEKYRAKRGAVTLHTWTEIDGLKKENFYITGMPGALVPWWFRNILIKKNMLDIVEFPHTPSCFYE